MSNPKVVAQELMENSKQSKVRFPKIWDDQRILQACGTTLMLFRDGSSFDLHSALQSLVDQYGVEEEDVTPSSDKKKRKKGSGSSAEAKTSASKSEDEEEAADQKAKKPRKDETVVVEENRAAAEAIKEMAVIYFTNKDARKGGVFSKGAKAIRECDFPIKTKKEAMSLKGVGKGIAGYVEELIETGMIAKLEELRAGTA